MANIVSQPDVYTYLGKTTDTIDDAEAALIVLLQPIVENLVKDYVGYEIALATFTEFLPHTGSSWASDDLIEGSAVEAANGRIRVGFDSQTPGRKLPLSNLPVRKVISVYEGPDAFLGDINGGDWSSATLLTPGTDYWIDFKNYDSGLALGVCWTGHLVRQAGIWLQSPRAYKVTYQAGFSADELSGRYGIFKLAFLQSLSKAYIEAKSHQENEGAGSGGVGAIIQERLGDYNVQYSPESARELTGYEFDLPKSVKRMLEPYRRMTQFV